MKIVIISKSDKQIGMINAIIAIRKVIIIFKNQEL